MKTSYIIVKLVKNGEIFVNHGEKGKNGNKGRLWQLVTFTVQHRDRSIRLPYAMQQPAARCIQWATRNSQLSRIQDTDVSEYPNFWATGMRATRNS